MYLILFTLPVMAFFWGIIGYIICKRMSIVLMSTVVLSTIFIFAYTGFDLSNLYWVLLMASLTFVSCGLSKSIYLYYQDRKKGKTR
ncbi:DUF2651 family protein [Bacillus sp. 179-C3.3 HS]